MSRHLVILTTVIAMAGCGRVAFDLLSEGDGGSAVDGSPAADASSVDAVVEGDAAPMSSCPFPFDPVAPPAMCPHQVIPVGNPAATGGFGSAVTIATAAPPGRIVSADFDSDGHDDLVIAASDPVFLFGGPDQMFDRVDGFGYRGFFALADANCDGQVDLLGGSGGCINGQLVVAINVGGRQFTEQFYSSICNPKDVVVGDFDGNGLREALLGGGGSQFTVHAGNAPGVTCELGFGFPYPDRMAAVDLDANGALDLVAVSFHDAMYALNDGDGGFPAGLQLLASQGAAPLVADFTSDGVPDLLVANPSSSSFAVYESHAQFPNRVKTTSSANPTALAVLDFNDDGNIDVIAAGEVAAVGTARVYQGNGDGTFAEVASFQVGLYPVDIATGDFDKDGLADVAVANFNSSNVTIAFGISGGN